MDFSDLGSDARKIVQEILGYLNFSSGAADPRFLRNLNELFGLIEGGASPAEAAWRVLGHTLRDGLARLGGTSDAFRRVDQAEAVVPLVFDDALPAYRRFHRDLLFHQSEEQLFRPLFIGRLCEAVLQQGGPWDESDRIVSAALGQLSDYLGHRPIAVLRTQQKIQPYAHEWVRPIPLYVRGAGIAVGRYREMVEKALEILAATDPAILFEAFFASELLDELSLDPRAYDFDHPNNKRPNYLFGQWDLDRLDLSGRCRRFVVQQVALDAMLERVENRDTLSRNELMFEAGAVLAGTMLMGSGVSGSRPDAHDSTVTLTTLVQRIAVYRDTFYEQLIGRVTGPYAERLRAEALALRQPFGGARQHFNQHLARRRAEQLQHVRLARVFAQMGFTEAAARQVRIVPVPSARMNCDIHCRLTAAHRQIDQGRLDQAAALLPEIEDLLHRAIECGAMVDPWNILGFGGQYSLFPSPENSVHDHRVDDLTDVVAELFLLCVRLVKEAAAAGNATLQESLSEALQRLAQWWDKYAACEVSGVEAVSGQETKQSADHVAAALRAWHEAGTAAGDLAFWRGHAEQFRSSKAYALVVDSLLDHDDRVAAMALLVQWLSQAGDIPLVEENHSFHDLALVWMEELWEDDGKDDDRPGAPRDEPSDRWTLAKKFLDYLEANADQYWQVPRFELGDDASADADAAEPEEEEDLDDPFRAAYEDVTYRDSTDDGFDGEMFEVGENATDVELLLEAERIVARLAFLATLAQLWKMAALASLPIAVELPDRDDVLAGWLGQAAANRQRLLELLASVHRYQIPSPRGTHESLVDYDRRRTVKETLLDQIIATCIEVADAGCMIRAAMQREQEMARLQSWEEPVGRVMRAVLRSDKAAVRKNWRALSDALERQPLLYVALARGGSPQRIVASRGLQRVLRRLLAYLPRLGLLRETGWLMETAQDMELDHPVGPGAVTEFDQVFEIGCRAIARCLVVSAETWHAAGRKTSRQQAELDLIGCLELAVEALLRTWLTHSHGVRLSVLETVREKRHWTALKRFIESYGRDLFNQRFMNLANLRGILHEGVDAYLDSLAEEPGAEEEFRLLADLDGRLGRKEAVHWLGLAIEAVAENYSEYIDYNSTTTQSDRGEMLYTLLDFLRLRAGYDRVAWNLQPVVLAHEVLVRHGRDAAAETWRKAVAQRTGSIADDHLKRLSRLSRKYGMRLPSIADRLGERFVRPLDIDRLCALVRPAVEELQDGGTSPTFARLERQVAQFTQEASGAGFDLPSWLEALQEEVDRAQARVDADDDLLDPLLRLPQVRLSRSEAQRQVRAMASDE